MLRKFSGAIDLDKLSLGDVAAASMALAELESLSKSDKIQFEIEILNPQARRASDRVAVPASGMPELLKDLAKKAAKPVTAAKAPARKAAKAKPRKPVRPLAPVDLEAGKFPASLLIQLQKLPDELHTTLAIAGSNARTGSVGKRLIKLQDAGMVEKIIRPKPAGQSGMANITYWKLTDIGKKFEP